MYNPTVQNVTGNNSIHGIHSGHDMYNPTVQNVTGNNSIHGIHSGHDMYNPTVQNVTWLEFRIMCSSGATCLPPDCCFSELALQKFNSLLVLP
jgi:hypothetical protein